MEIIIFFLLLVLISRTRSPKKRIETGFADVWFMLKIAFPFLFVAYTLDRLWIEIVGYAIGGFFAFISLAMFILHFSKSEHK